MHTLYNSDSFVVVSFDLPSTKVAAAGAPGAADAAAPLARGGFEIVDKLARKEIFIAGALAEHFHQGVQALVNERQGSDTETLHAVIDDFIAGYTALAQQPVLLH